MTVVLFLIILAVLIFVHELGHFLAAKAFGIRVDEFAIGFPPKVFGWKKGETEYKINLIPLGGYVKIFGEDPNEESLSGPDASRSITSASKWKQIVVLLAGIFMNIIFAWLLISISFNIGMVSAIEEKYKDKADNVSVLVLSVIKDSPSDLAGLKKGDNILAIETGDKRIVSPTVTDIQEVIAISKDIIKVDYKRETATGTLNIIAKDGVVEGKKAIGISMSLVGVVKHGFLRSFYEGAKLTVFETTSIAKGMISFIAGAFTGRDGLLTHVAGPVGIAGMVGDARDIGFSYLLGFIAMISINLAVLNAVPFPALDGGRVFFVLVEVIIRRKIKPIFLNWVNLIGFGLLLLLMVVITYKDILRIFK